MSQFQFGTKSATHIYSRDPWSLRYQAWAVPLESFQRPRYVTYIICTNRNKRYSFFFFFFEGLLSSWKYVTSIHSFGQIYNIYRRAFFANEHHFLPIEVSLNAQEAWSNSLSNSKANQNNLSTLNTVFDLRLRFKACVNEPLKINEQ